MVVLCRVTGKMGGGIEAEETDKYKKITVKDGHGVRGVAWRQSLLGAVRGGDPFLSLGISLCQEWGQKWLKAGC